jgi:hypothetical protein
MSWLPTAVQAGGVDCPHAWRISDLEAAYDRLLATDLAIKTVKLPDDLALDLLVVELSERR